MSQWRYKAVSADALAGGGVIHTGELAGDSAAAVRAALRNAGMQVIDLRQLRTGPHWPMAPLMSAVAPHLCRRRNALKGELFDSLATMLDAGLPLLDALHTLSGAGGRSSAARTMLLGLHDRLRSGDALATAMRAYGTWFGAPEVAMIEAGQRRGELANVLRRLADRHERSGELSSRLVGVLAYPAIVALVGLGVVVFLSTKTLPNLAAILQSAKIPVPGLTVALMAVGQAVAHWWWLWGLGILVVLVGTAGAFARTASRSAEWPQAMRRCVPTVFRKVALAGVAVELAELVRAGVPFVESLRVLAPTLTGPVSTSLGRRLREAADRVERGEPIEAALEDPLWFDGEFTRLLTVGRTSGELDQLLERLGQRELRRTRRLVDRLAALLEPAVILVLAAVVGLVVMAAIQPLIRLQEVV